MKFEQLTTQQLGLLLRSNGYLARGRGDLDDPLACLLPPLKRTPLEHCSTLHDLFLYGKELPQDEASEALLSTQFLEDLIAAGLLTLRDQHVQAAIAIVPVMDYLVATERPMNTESGVVLPHDYLSAYSTILAQYVRLRSPHGTTIDVGSGTGLQSMVLGETADRVFACDIDRLCCKRTQTTSWLNKRVVDVLESDLLDACPEDISVVVSNPPWRIMPASIPYPARGSRVGAGHDGLDLVRRLVCSLPCHVSERAECHLIFEAPSNGTPPPFLEELLALVGSHGFGIQAKVMRSTPVESVIRRSLQVVRGYAGDEDIEAHEQSLRDRYRQIQANALSLMLLTLDRSSSSAGRIVVQK